MRTPILTLLALATSAGAWAADAPSIESLTASQSEKITAIFAQQQRNMADGCKVLGISRAKAIQITQPLGLNAQNQPASGQWNVRFAVNTCGKEVLRTARFTVTPKGVAIDALAPGQTLTDAQLQKDVEKSFGMAAVVAMPKCNAAPVLRDTKVHAFPATPKDGWMEIWIASVCGRDFGQMVQFLPGKNGTVFKMSLPKTASK